MLGCMPRGSLGKAVLWLPIVVTQVVFPSLVDGNADPKQSQRLIRNASVVVVVLATVAVGGLYVFGSIVYRLLYGERYEAAADVAWKIGLAVIPLALVNLLMFQLLARRNGAFLKWLVMFAVLESFAPVPPPVRGWYAATLGIVGLGLLVALLVAVRGGVVSQTATQSTTASHPSDGLSLS